MIVYLIYLKMNIIEENEKRFLKPLLQQTSK